MKKNNKILFTVIAMISLFAISCDNKDNGTGYSTYNPETGITGSVALNFEPNSVGLEADENVYSYTVTIDKPQSIAVDINVIQIGGTAKAGDKLDFDFERSITIPPFETSATGKIFIYNDIENEGQEEFTLRISDSRTANATIAAKELTIKIDNSCPSALAGVCNYVTTNCYSPGPPASNVAGPFTGSVTFTPLGKGVYTISDVSFGGWIGLYGPNQFATGVKLVDDCNKISLTGVDQFNEVFTLTNLLVSGKTLYFHWANDYGEYGDTALTRADGADWPALSL